MSSDWAALSAGELERLGVLLVQDGNHGEYRPRADEFVSVGTCFIRAADLANGRILFEQASRINDTALARIRKGIGHPGDVLVSHKGTVGRVAHAPESCEPFVCSPQTTFWRSLSPDVIDQEYLFAYTRSPLFQRQLDAFKGESDMAPYVSLSVQRTLHLYLPPIDEQRRIAGVLGALDDKIGHNRDLMSKLEEALALHFRHLVAESSDVGVLGDQVEVVMGQSPPGSTYSGNSSGVPLVQGMASFGERFPQPDVYTSAPTKRARRGDVLMTVRAPVGEINVVDGDYCAGRGVAVIRGHHLAYTDQLMRFLQSSWREHETGTIYPSVNRAQIVSLPAPKPADDAIEKFEALAKPIYDLIGARAREQAHLAAARDTLLPKLVSGAIRVPESYDPDDALGTVAESAGIAVP